MPMLDISTVVQTAKTFGVDKMLGALLMQFQRKEKQPKGVVFSTMRQKDTRTSFEDHATDVATWASTMEYQYGGKPLNLDRNYLDLEIWLNPLASGGPESEKEKTDIWTLIAETQHHIVLLGRPGTGKTTTLKAVARAVLTGDTRISGYYPIPIVIRLREAADNQSLFGALLLYMGIETITPPAYFDQPNSKAELREVQSRLLIQTLNQNKYLVILDGYDELPLEEKRSFASAFQVLTRGVTSSLIILSSRTADFIYTSTNAASYEIATLSIGMIESFIENFFIESQTFADRAKNEIIGRKLLGAEAVPLTLTYLCMIYSRYERLFNSRREIYNKILDLLLEDWDIDRQISRPSQFSGFDVHDKKRFLRNLAFELSSHRAGSFFSEEAVHAAFSKISSGFGGIENDDMKQVFREIESHTGLFVYAGDGYEFQHKTMQEYLFARHMHEFPVVPADKTLLLAHPNELALAVSFNDNPTLYLAYLIMERFDWEFYREEFIAPFLDRLALEKVEFQVHPYLGICAIQIHAGIREHRVRGGGHRWPQDTLGHFYRLLQKDNRMSRSLNLLRDFYSVENMDSKKNSIALHRKLIVDESLGYQEPMQLIAPFEFVEYLTPGAAELKGQVSN